VPRHPGGVLAALARLPSNFARHGEQTCASAYFFFANSPWRAGCELVASKCASLPIFSFDNSPLRVGCEQTCLSTYFWPGCTLFLVFHLCSVP